MDSSSELIENLLKNSGLSCDDLLLKLQQYKSLKCNVDEKKDVPSSTSTSQENAKNFNANESVILGEVDSTVESSTSRDEINDMLNVAVKNKDENEISDKNLASSIDTEQKTDDGNCDIATENVATTSEEPKSTSEKCDISTENISVSVIPENPESVNQISEAEAKQSVENEKENSSIEDANKFMESKNVTLTEKGFISEEKLEAVENNEISDNSETVKMTSPELHESKQENQADVSEPPSNEDNVLKLRTTVLSKKDLSSDSFELEINNENNRTSVEDVHHPISLTDHDYDDKSDSQMRTSTLRDVPNSTRDEVLLKTEDSLRDVIRMQLSSLRNMKKSNEYLPDLKSKSVFFHSLKKKRKSCDISTVTSLPDPGDTEKEKDDMKNISVESEINSESKKDENAVDEKETSKNIEEEEQENLDNSKNTSEHLELMKIEENSVEDQKICNETISSLDENSLISLSDETEFIIVDVAGGVEELPSETEKEEKDEASSNSVSEEKCEDNDAKLTTNITISPRTQIKDILINSKRKRYNLISTGSEQKTQCLVVKNISESFNHDPGVNRSVKNSEKSPFVSDSLEDFLSESAQLKISYSIPKLGAEDGITKDTKRSVFDVSNANKSIRRILKVEAASEQDTTPKEKPKIIKAKTLAEMRRQFEKMKEKEKFESLIIKKEENDVDFGTADIKGEFIYTSNRNCFLMYGNKKLLLSGNVKNKCVAVIDSKVEKQIIREKLISSSTPKLKQNIHRRPSIFSSLGQNKRFKVRYKPGPLCKKVNLQSSEKDKWVSELKTLPKIYLEVTPEIHKPFAPKLLHLLPFFDNPIITEERTDFALSVLQTKDKNNNEPKSFSFQIPYKNNQEQLLVRKRCKPIAPTEIKKPVIESDDPTKEVGIVLDKLITYVETKEIENTVIKEDEATSEEVTEQKNVENNGRGKRARKRRRLDIELLRLNCKVIDVASNATDNKDCSKPHCRLGCVCKSLRCESVFSNHCQLVRCMFECACPPVSSNEVKSANAGLSAHTVNHLEDKVKKNLAKVEREFTQTLIHTDNDVIFLGNGKSRRSSKPPKKYNDYVADDTILDSPTVNDLPLKDCSVVAQKLDLEDVSPFCLYHNLYNCYCKGEVCDFPPMKRSHKVETVEQSPSKRIKMSNQIPKIRIVRTKEDQHKSWSDSCARIRKVFSEYRKRNKDPIYNERLRTKNQHYVDNEFSIKEEMNLQDIEMSGGMSNSSDCESQMIKKTNKRKQSFNIREDFPPAHSPRKQQNKEFALQRRKKKIKPNIFVKEISKVPVETPKYYTIFDGEIKVSLKENEEIFKMIGIENTSLEYLRILPWVKLIEGFRLRKINIWAREKRSSMLLCNGAGYFPPKHFIDIRLVKLKSDIINWILMDNLPQDRPKELMHLILTPKKGHFLIAGYCLKKNQELPRPSHESNCNKNDINIKVEVPQVLESVSPKRSESGSSIEDTDEIEIDSEKDETSQKSKSIDLVQPPVLLGDSRKKNISQIRRKSLIRKVLPTRKIYQKIDTEKLKLPASTQITPIPNNSLDKPTATSSSGPKIKQVEIFKNSGRSVKLAALSKAASAEKTVKKEVPNQISPTRNLKMKSILNPVRPISSGKSTAAAPEKTNTSLNIEPLPNNQMKSAELNKGLPQKQISTPMSTTLSRKQLLSKCKKATSECRLQSLIPTRSQKCTHKDMHNESKTLILTNREFPTRKLYFSKDDSECELTVSLPQISKKFKWWMVYLNSDFTFLNFVKADYSIKYTDLMDVVKMANNIRSTITLRNDEFCNHYKHPIFGIYCLPHFQDRLFIGPFLPSEKHHIEFLRYLQGKLINTQTFNKMLGRKESGKRPTWIYETPVESTLFTDLSSNVIDITEDDEVSENSDNINSHHLYRSLLCPPFVEELNPDELKLRKVINRYIMTNIPHLGYFGACQRDSKAIEVFFPNSVRGYRFPNVTFAKNALIHYLTQIFCPIPHDFKINVIIMTHLDLKTNKPVNIKYFTKKGPFFCGEFGIYETHAITTELLDEYDVPSVEFLLEQHKKLKENEDSIVKLFGLFLMSNEELRKHTNPDSILEWAKSEIYILKKLSENYESEKGDLQNIIRMNASKIKEKYKAGKVLEPVERGKIKLSETIEITDSDDETKDRESSVKTLSSFKKICASGKVGNSTVLMKHGDRSLLKPKIWVKSGRSLLKSSEKKTKTVTGKSVEVSLRNSSIVLDKNKVLITKI